MLVALADKLWNGKRGADLEERAARLLPAVSGRDFWSVWSEVDSVFERVAASGDERLVRTTTYDD
ncbi:MAG: hypothetical protein GY723_14660 [bacterium]|nr:hypothetical protein [bacterium]